MRNGCRAGGVEAQERDLVIGEEGLQLRADVTAIAGEPSDKALDDIVERNIVVAGDDDDGPGQSLEKGAGGGALPTPGALRQVAGDDNDVRLRLRYVGQQALGRGLVVPPEMQIRQMSDRSHGGTGPRAPTTPRAPPSTQPNTAT